MAEYLGAFAFFALVAGQFLAVVAMNNWQPETLKSDEKAAFAHRAPTPNSEMPLGLAKAA